MVVQESVRHAAGQSGLKLLGGDWDKLLEDIKPFQEILAVDGLGLFRP